MGHISLEAMLMVIYNREKHKHHKGEKQKFYRTTNLEVSTDKTTQACMISCHQNTGYYNIKVWKVFRNHCLCVFDFFWIQQVFQPLMDLQNAQNK